MLNFSKLKILFISFIVLLGFLFIIPNFFDKDLKYFPSKKLNLGLDLQGGSYLLLEADIKPVVSQKFQLKITDISKKLRSEKISYSNFKTTDKEIIFDVKDTDKNQVIKLLNSSELNISISGNNKEYLVSSNQKSINLEFTQAFFDQVKKNSIEQSLEVIRNRIDQIGTKEPNIISQGNSRILVELPGLKDPSEIKKLIGKTAKLTFRFLANNNKDEFGYENLTGKNKSEKYVVEKKIIISGENLVDAQPGFDNINSSPLVTFKLDSYGAKKFAYFTKNNIGRNLAIVLDNEVVSAPVIRDAITTGNGQISGNFTPAEANNLAILLRSGALPAPLQIIEERSVGPDLGKDSIDKGIISLIVGFVLVVLYMIINYKIFGIFANLSLFLNIVLLISTLSILEATLTLPGIAGIVLTIGMAVDANVLIYERIREEIKIENNNYIAVEAGYKRALTTLLDANITTLISAFVLYFIGTGPIKGFAVTLSIGIITSLFTTYTVGRLFVSVYLKNHKNNYISI